LRRKKKPPFLGEEERPGKRVQLAGEPSTRNLPTKQQTKPTGWADWADGKSREGWLAMPPWPPSEPEGS
jgi:hypothetical protein